MSRRQAGVGRKADTTIADPSPKPSPQGKDKRLLHIGIAFIALVVVAFLAWLFISGTASEFFDALMHAHPAWVLAGIGCFVGYLVLDSACYRVAGMLTGSRLGARDVVSVAAAGIVFGYLTPSQMGGAPAQVVRLSQVGLKVGDATAVQITKFFVYQAAVTLLGATVMIAEYAYFVERFGNIVIVSILSFGVHLLIMAFMVAIVVAPGLVRSLCHLLVRLGSGFGPDKKLRVFKDPAALHARVDDEVDEYAGAVRSAIRHGGVVITAVAVTILQLASLYCAPYCVLRALGVESVDFFTTLCAAAFIQLIMTAVPLPGGTGGAEGGFVLFFGPELGALTAVGTVLWRAFTFYLPVLICLPLLGLRSKLSPAQRLERFGEAHVGREGRRDAIRIARGRVVELRDAAGRRLRPGSLRRGQRVFVTRRRGVAAVTPSLRAWRQAHRLRRRGQGHGRRTGGTPELGAKFCQ